MNYGIDEKISKPLLYRLYVKTLEKMPMNI